MAEVQQMPSAALSSDLTSLTNGSALGESEGQAGFFGSGMDNADRVGAGSYSFFGNMDGADDGLEGGLEDGVSAPPEEDFIADGALEDGTAEDLSFASMFSSTLQLQDGENSAAKGFEPQSIVLTGISSNDTAHTYNANSLFGAVTKPLNGNTNAIAGFPDPFAAPSSNFEQLFSEGRPILGADALQGFNQLSQAQSQPPLRPGSADSLGLSAPQMQVPGMSMSMAPTSYAALPQQRPAALPQFLPTSLAQPYLPRPTPTPVTQGYAMRQVLMGQNMVPQQMPQQRPAYPPNMMAGIGAPTAPPMQPQYAPVPSMPPQRAYNTQARPAVPPVYLPTPPGQPLRPVRPPTQYQINHMGIMHAVHPQQQQTQQANYSRQQEQIVAWARQQANEVARQRSNQELAAAVARNQMGALNARRYGSKYMDPEEIEQILRIQWKSLNSGSPYLEDYYYQAYQFKNNGQRNIRTFAPEQLRDAAPAEKLTGEPTAYVNLDGLGKIPFSNIRRPRPLMDLTPDELRMQREGNGEDRPLKPLEQEPLLAARIMIEDCMYLLLDVDDIDRMFAAGGARDDAALLRQRRALLMEGLAASLRLPDNPVPPPPGTPASTPDGRDAGDGVFLRLVALPKGRTLLARALKLMYPPPYAEGPEQSAPPLRILWATLRNVRYLFGADRAAAAAGQRQAKADFSSMNSTEVTSKIAAAAVDVARRLENATAVCNSIAAVVAGDLNPAEVKDTAGDPAATLMPLYPPGVKATESQVEWLADVLVALLLRASELGLADASLVKGVYNQQGGPTNPEAKAWRTCFDIFFGMVIQHMQVLLNIYKTAQAQGAQDTADLARGMVPVNLIRATLPHATDKQREQLRACLSELN